MKQNLAFKRRRKRGKVRIGPGLRDCEAGYKTIIVVSCALYGEGYCIKRGGRTFVSQGRLSTPLFRPDI